MSSAGPHNAAGQRTLEPLVADVLGKLAFMVGEEPGSPPPAGTVWLLGTIEYRGPISGALHCWCTRAFARNLAANLLGLDPDTDAARRGAEDAVREFMNVLCGQLITSWYGRDPVFALSIPEAGAATGSPPSAPATGETLAQLVVGSEPLCCLHRPGGAARPS